MISADVLSTIGLFAGLRADQLAAIAETCEEKACLQAGTLFREGDHAEQFYVLLEGKVSLQVQLSSRPEAITIAIAELPGLIFGWSGMVAPYAYTASAICQKDSRFLAINGQALLSALEQDPAMGFLVMRRIAELVSNRLRSMRVALLKTL